MLMFKDFMFKMLMFYLLIIGVKRNRRKWLLYIMMLKVWISDLFYYVYWILIFRCFSKIVFLM